MTAAKDMLSLLKDLEDSGGFRVEKADSTRYRVFAPDGDLTFLSTQSANGTRLANAKAWAKRHGFESATSKKLAAVPAARPTPPLVPPTEVKKRKVAAVPSPFAEPPIAENASAEPVAEAAPAPVKVEVTVSTTAPESPAAPPLKEVPATTAVRLPEGHPAHPPASAQLVVKADGIVAFDIPVSPALAREFLEFNNDNRPVQWRLVHSYARSMADGAWVPEIADPVRFADTGKMIDGQKRLLAIDESGVTVRTTLVVGLPESAQDVIDSGQHRSVADQLKINGYPNAMIVASASRLLWLWEHGSLVSGDPAPSNGEQLDFVPLLSGPTSSIEESATVAAGSGARKVISPSVIAATHYRMSCVDRPAADEFHGMLSSGAGMAEKSPVLALRETMLRRRDLGQKLTQAEQVFFTARAWVLWRENAEVTRLQFPKDRLTMAHIPLI